MFKALTFEWVSLICRTHVLVLFIILTHLSYPGVTIQMQGQFPHDADPISIKSFCVTSWIKPHKREKRKVYRKDPTRNILPFQEDKEKYKHMQFKILSLGKSSMYQYFIQLMTTESGDFDLNKNGGQSTRIASLMVRTRVVWMRCTILGIIFFENI